MFMKGGLNMNVERYFDDGILFDVIYLTQSGAEGISYYLFPIDYSEKQVKNTLKNNPYNVNVLHVFESRYVLKIKSEYIKS